MLEQLLKLMIEKQNELAHASMQVPSTERHMLLAGQYQGIQMVRDMIDDLLRGQD